MPRQEGLERLLGSLLRVEHDVIHERRRGREFMSRDTQIERGFDEPGASLGHELRIRPHEGACPLARLSLEVTR